MFGIKRQRRRIDHKRRKVIWYRDGRRCRYCSKKLHYEKFHLDHILPLSHGGNDYVFNLCAACSRCNLRKGANRRTVPRDLSIFRKIYGLFLIVWFGDYPKLSDYF